MTSTKTQHASERATAAAQKQALMFKQYQTIRYFIRDIDALGNNVNSIADMRSKLDAFIAQWGHSNYSRNLEEYIQDAVKNANDKGGYNADGTPKQRLVMGGVTYVVDFSAKFYSDDRVKLIAERSVTYTDTATGKSWHWQAIAWVERNAEDEFTGFIYRYTYLNGVLHCNSRFNFGRVMNPLFGNYSDPMQTVDSFLTHAEFLTKQMNQ